jgi:hypothetical protein
MNTSSTAVDAAIQEVERVRKVLAANGQRQVTNSDDRDYIRSVAYSWFNTHRREVIAHPSRPELGAIDDEYRTILNATAKHASRSTYLKAAMNAKALLVELRAGLLVAPSADLESDEVPPPFEVLATDPVMQGILLRRWVECQKCLKGEAFLAATVMMGGLLEALFVARANRMADKAPLFRAKMTPVDTRTKRALDLRDWTLRAYIDVGHELGWITASGKDVAAVLRDYRNYVHPEKERSHGVALNYEDARMFWEVTKSLVRQLLKDKPSQ